MRLFSILTVLLLAISNISQANAAVCDAFIPHTNGCSDKGIDDINFTTDFHESCVSHDYCYQKIGRERLDCDGEFYDSMIQSCKDKYLKYEAWGVVDTFTETLYGLYCSKYGVPYLCWADITQNIYGWVEVAKEAATKITELVGYPFCIAAAEAYYIAVRNKGGPGYRDYQNSATRHAEGLARSHAQNSCPVLIAANDSNLFVNNEGATVNGLYNNILARPPNDEEVLASQSIFNTINWQYDLTNELVRIRTNNALMSIIVNSVLE